MNSQIMFITFVIVSVIGLSALPPLASAATTISDGELVIQEVVTGLNESSGFEFIGDDILVTQKSDGKVRLIRNFELKQYSVLDLNVYNAVIDSGLLGITSTIVNGTTYVFFFITENPGKDDGGGNENGAGNRVYRYEWNPTSLELINTNLIIDLPSAPTPVHTGGKILIGPDGYLYSIIGDLTREGKEQNTVEDKSKGEESADNRTGTSGILRTTIEGQPSPGNPFDETGFERYYAYGIRNSFGLAFEPLTGNLWDTEKGPGVFDELNLVRPGFNSGWKQIQGNSDELCCMGGDSNAPRLSQDVTKLYEIPGSYYDEPKYVWGEAPSITALTFVSSDALGRELTNDLFVGDMQGVIYHFELDASRENIVSSGDPTDVVFATGLGPISDMKIGSDGALYVLTFSNSQETPFVKESGSLYRIAKDTILTGDSRVISTDNAVTVTLILIAAVIVTLVIITSKTTAGDLRSH